ncbi:sulfite reductase subunit alpha [Variovorax saccharolyticus]|uniref:sulfite reductase subunit alpha n=1 Tax=Variovorax saccharolyticus TaxID=3053516 RepID=UPI002578D837|nr:sulfite reductase subunit alpha [Variovorax sp. J22R187]MDM0016549.1 sulfite reductase subunit alpha [Variovorax sp. J22R187]
MNETALRALAAGLTLLAYAALCAAIWMRQRRRREALTQRGAALAGNDPRAATLVLFASQTGQAEALAWQTGRWLHDAGTPARVMSLNEANAELLRQAPQALFIASTYGEGDAPDGASVFAEHIMGAKADLSSLRYAVLALGDRQYANFCRFGRLLDDWLHAAGATRSFERIEVDNAEPAALAAWQSQWGGAPADDAADTAEAAAAPWRLARRSLLNGGSAGAPVYLLAFAPASGPAPHWESGDIAQLSLASDPGRPRDYSIASIPTDGELHLLVRQERHPDGSLGAGSGLLTSSLGLGDTLQLRLRPHRNFRLGENAQRPLLLIGNGTGLAGLRGHLRARAALGRHDNWLVFGERNEAHDYLCRGELEAWQRTGVLQRLDMVFSRDQAERRYVQHRLLQLHEEVRDWIARDAAIYVCGSLQGMAGGVDAALRQIVGEAGMGELLASGRYRRDVY